MEWRSFHAIMRIVSGRDASFQDVGQRLRMEQGSASRGLDAYRMRRSRKTRHHPRGRRGASGQAVWNERLCVMAPRSRRWRIVRIRLWNQEIAMTLHQIRASVPAPAIDPTLPVPADPQIPTPIDPVPDTPRDPPPDQPSDPSIPPIKDPPVPGSGQLAA